MRTTEVLTYMDQQIRSNRKPILKQATTDNFYQSTFMPIFQKAETKIKKLVLMAFFLMLAKQVLESQILGVIMSVDKQVPKSLKDREQYIKGLRRTADYYIRTFYVPMTRSFQKVQKESTSLEIKPPKTPKDVGMWSKRKGTPNVTNYENELKRRIEELAKEPALTAEKGKKPISLWQKAELDVRYNKQMEMLKKLTDDGVVYAYTSSHPNCSKRCSPWQGKLMHLTAHGDANFRVGKIDGRTVYSLTDIMNQVDKYGYNNNIICGFNCRHYLIPYTGQYAPEKYSASDIKEQRETEEKIRRMERKIRHQKTRAELYEEIGEKRIYRAIMNNVKDMTDQYESFCEKNGYAWYKYRITID